MTQIVRPTVPFLDAPDGKSGLGDIDIQHVFVPETHDWSTLGFGYNLSFPTADHQDLGAGKYQAGPAATMIYYGQQLADWCHHHPQLVLRRESMARARFPNAA